MLASQFATRHRALNSLIMAQSSETFNRPLNSIYPMKYLQSPVPAVLSNQVHGQGDLKSS